MNTVKYKPNPKNTNITKSYLSIKTSSTTYLLSNESQSHRTATHKAKLTLNSDFVSSILMKPFHITPSTASRDNSHMCKVIQPSKEKSNRELQKDCCQNDQNSETSQQITACSSNPSNTQTSIDNNQRTRVVDR